MSNWIHSYQSLRTHPKTIKLARRVGSIPLAIGHLHCLWWWSADYAKDGDLTKFSAEDIAIAVGWEGEPQQIIDYLVECEFLENGNGLQIHDHYEYIGRHLERAEADAERKRLARRDKISTDLSTTVRRTSSGRPVDGARSAHVDRKIDREIDRTRADASDGSATPSAREKAEFKSLPIAETIEKMRAGKLP